MKKILILGGTGPIGTGVTNILTADENNRVYITTRQSTHISGDRVTYVHGNAHDRSFLYPLLESNKWDAIIDCLIYPYFEFQTKVDKFLENTSQYIYISSATVFADSEIPLTEDSTKLADVCTDDSFVYSDVYAITKAHQERLLQMNSKKNWTIIRPYITYGTNRLQLGCMEKEYWLYGALHHRPIVFAHDIADKYVTMTCCDDVGKCIVAALGHPSALANDYNAVCNHHMKWSDILNIYADAIEKRYNYRPEVYWTDNYEPYQGGGRFEDYKYDRLYNRIFDNHKLTNLIDPSRFVTPKEGLTKCMNSFMNDPQFKHINYMAEIKKAQVTKHWPTLREFTGIKTKLYVELLKLNLIPSSL